MTALDTTVRDGRVEESEELDVASIRLLELRHRIKNLLAITQAVANQTLRSGRSIEEARVALDGRLAAMGGAVDMLLQTGWSAAGLTELLGRALLHEAPRIAFDGPELVLGPDAAMALTLVLHELESNSIKYGALSADDGRVAVAWAVEDDDGTDCLRFTWSESGGPLCAAPTRKGFGSRMTARLVGGPLRGKVEADYPPEGLRWRLTAPLATMTV